MKTTKFFTDRTNRYLKLVLVPLFCLVIINLHGQNTRDYQHHWDPPWDTLALSEFSDATLFSVYGIDNLPDFHGDINNPDLVIFFAGNQYMVIPELLQAFRKEHPEYKRVFAETIPPGIEDKQIKSGALLIGNARITLKPDIVTAGKGKIMEQDSMGWFSQTTTYAKNKLAIMVYKGNPKNIKTLNDLGKPNIRVSMPNPQWEGIAGRITEAYENAGGKALKDQIMTKKNSKGTTFLTTVHHRQTPMRIMYKLSDAGPVWYSEAYYHSKLTDHPIDMVLIDDSVNVQAVYMAGQMKNAPHPEAAKTFMGFLTSATAKSIYKKYGFEIP